MDDAANRPSGVDETIVKRTSSRRLLSFATSLMVVALLVFFGLERLALSDETIQGGSAPAPPPELTEQERAWLSRHRVVRIGGPRAFPPFSFFDSDGELKGMAQDYADSIMARLGVRLERVGDIPWPEVMKRAREKEIDLISCAAKTPEREDYLLFSSPYLSFPLVIISRKDVSFIGGLDDLRGRTVAFVRENSAFDWVKRDGVVVTPLFVNSPLDALRAVSSGHAEAHIENLAAAGYLIEKHGLANLKVASPTRYENYELHFAVRKDWPELVGIINKALMATPREQHAEIRNRWLSVRYEYGISKEDVLKWGLIVVAAVLFMVAPVLLWNRRLHKEIRERVTAEKSLRESEEKMRSIFRAAPVGIGLAINRVVKEVNVRVCEMTGYSREELIGSNARVLYPTDEDFDLVGKEKYAQIAEQGVGTVETLWKKKDGAVINVLLSSTPLDTTDLSRGVTFTALDITSLKLAEAEKDRLMGQLAQVRKMEAVGRLAGGIAHDFNNMLHGILGYVDLAMIETPKESPVYDMLRQIGNAGRRSADLVRQLLAFARKQTISPKILDVNETIEKMLGMLQRLIGEDVELAWLPAPGSWPVKMDPSQIDQILANLCVNARDAIEGVGKVIIETGNVLFDESYCCGHADCSPGEYVMLAVSDNGCGMEKSVSENVFEPFFTTKDMGKGTGLGLATVYGIVKQNNGFINVYSEPGKGTTIKIYLPRSRDHVVEEGRVPEARRDLRGSETVLLVEDDEYVLDLGRNILERHGYLVLAASSPRDALRLAESHSGPIDLLITDVIMPEMNGKDLKERLHAFHPDMKCIFMSGYTANVIAHHGVLDEGVHFLQKPFSVKPLTEKAREVLDS